MEGIRDWGDEYREGLEQHHDLHLDYLHNRRFGQEDRQGGYHAKERVQGTMGRVGKEDTKQIDSGYLLNWRM